MVVAVVVVVVVAVAVAAAAVVVVMPTKANELNFFPKVCDVMSSARRRPS